MFLTIEVSKKEERYYAYCVELEVEASDITSDKAIAKLKKVINFYLSTAKDSKNLDGIHQFEDEPLSHSLLN